MYPLCGDICRGECHLVFFSPIMLGDISLIPCGTIVGYEFVCAPRLYSFFGYWFYLVDEGFFS